MTESTCDKRTFETKKDALLSNSESKYRKQKGSLQKKPCKAYQCSMCGKFHLTSQDMRKPKVAKKSKLRIEKEVKKIRHKKIDW